MDGLQDSHNGGDALQRRVARLVASVPPARAINSGEAFCLGTSLGSLRKKNEDRALVMFASYANALDRNFGLAVLADGMGGLPHGDEAAILGVSVFVARILRTPRLSIADRLVGAALAASDAIHVAYGGRAGATLSAVLLNGTGQLTGINIGDSRIYGISSERDLVPLSKDDTLAGVLGHSNRKGPEQNHLVQYLGMGEGLEPHVINAPRPFDTILLTTDGVHGAAPDLLGTIVRGSPNGPDLVRKLLALSDVVGGRDNSTAVAIDTRFAFDTSATDHGLSLTFSSVKDGLEVWIPLLFEENRDNKSLVASDQGSIDSSVETKKASGTGRKRRRGGAKKARGKVERGEARLPLDEDRPLLDVKFPKSEE